ncbi:MAG: IclR family transcriptional regulator [Herpetosiphon sp.]
MSGITAVERALDILQYLAQHRTEHGVRALALKLEMSPSSAFRLLATLEQRGFVKQNTVTGRYAIGVRAVQLGISALGSLDLTSIAPPHLRTLVHDTGESAFLAVRDAAEIVYLLKEEGTHSIRTTAMLGSRRPLHCTGLGKSFLAEMPSTEAEALLRRVGMTAYTHQTITNLATLQQELAVIRQRGFAVDNEEVEQGLLCVAAPIRDYRGETIAAISMAGPVVRMRPYEDDYGRRIVATAFEISTALGYMPEGDSVRSGSVGPPSSSSRAQRPAESP